MNDSTTTIFGVNEKVLTMELERNIRAVANKVHTAHPATKNVQAQNQNQGLSTLIVMLVVLTIIVLFCCFSAPGIRGLCKKYIFRSCPYDDPEVDNASTTNAESVTTPTVILLPYGRMLVVDSAVFTQLHADQSGLDLLELSANLIRNQNSRPVQMTGSTPSILDSSDNTSKGWSPTSLGYGPPAYEDIFGLCSSNVDLPPSYSEVSLMLKNQRNGGGECIELRRFGGNADCRTVELVEESVSVEMDNEDVPTRSDEAV